MHVFISYSRRNTAFVEQLERDLNRHQIITWRDVHSIPGGEDWFRNIQTGVDACYAVLYIDTPEAYESPWVRKEFLWAMHRQRPIIPIKLDPAFMCPLTIDLNPFLCDPPHYETGLRQVVARLGELPQEPAVPGTTPPAETPQAGVAPEAAADSDLATDTRAFLDWVEVQGQADLQDALYVELQATPEKGRMRPAMMTGWGGLDDPQLSFDRLRLEPVQGEHLDPHGEEVDDARQPLREMRRVILLGEPGSGKTTTLVRLAIDLAREARQALENNPHARLPVFIPLRQFTGSVTDGDVVSPQSFGDFVRQQMYTLQNHYDALLNASRLVLLCDALNEMPRRAADGRDLVAEVRDYLRQRQDWIISCRVRDYQEELSDLPEVGKVRLKPLDPPRIQKVILRRFDRIKQPGLGEKLWQALHGSEVLLKAWKTVHDAGIPDTFWQPAKPAALEWFSDTYNAWRAMQGDKRRLLALCRNPYMTNMICQLYAQRAVLPANRGALFADFVDHLLRRDQVLAQSVGATWLDNDLIRQGLAQIAYRMGAKSEMPRLEAETILREHLPGIDHGLLLRLATGASLLDVGTDVRFTHQLLQEYFASEVLGTLMDKQADPAAYWPLDRWWEPNGREETLIILAGVRGDPEAVARWVAPAQPELAFQALTDSGIPVDLDHLEPATRDALLDSARQKTGEVQAVGRAAAYRVLGRLTADDRPGVGLRDDGLPHIVWGKTVEAGSFQYGDNKDVRRIDYPYAVSRYPITNAQFSAFIQVGGYAERRYWTEDGWEQKQRHTWTEPRYWQEAHWNVPNHPVVGVSWYEAVVFCHWLTQRYRAAGLLDGGEVIRLPTEEEWEQAARGTDGRVYPWGDVWDAARCNNSVAQPAIGQTSAVGIFPAGDSPCRASDMAGNVWEWCLTNYKTGENTLEGTDVRVLRGGAWYDLDTDDFRAAVRSRLDPDNWYFLFGFRVARSSYSDF